jgi:hypothetical protein
LENLMSTADTTSPRAAELYFNSSLIGHLSALLAENLAGSRNRRPAPRDPVRAKPTAGVTKALQRPRKLLDRLDAWFWRQEQKRREAYLAGSRDLFELERRMEAIDRSAFARYY